MGSRFGLPHEHGGGGDAGLSGLARIETARVSGDGGIRNAMGRWGAAGLIRDGRWVVGLEGR